MLSNSPGNIGFEAAPFKLTFDYVEVMGGVDSPAFREFKKLFHDGFQSARGGGGGAEGFSASPPTLQRREAGQSLDLITT
jgi:hypothetical protein